MKKIGIIGGTGLEKLSLFDNAVDKVVSTKYGSASSPLLTAQLGDKEICILSRHGRDHSIPPTQINNRANILAMKKYGVDMIIATTACGSLQEEIGRGHVVILDQFIDFTKRRVSTFFDEFQDGELKHTPMADPFDKDLRKILNSHAEEMGIDYHDKGTVITIEGPRFSSRAESNMFRSWNADVINMTTAPEVVLANEAEIPYAAIALSTDYDCWKVDEEPVSWEEVLKVFHANVEKVRDLLVKTIHSL